MSDVILPPLVAYQERPSCDPETGAEGILRDEWRVSVIASSHSLGTITPEALVAAFGDDWRSYRPFASHVLEHRYIRRGVEETWVPFRTANSFEQALADIDGKAVALVPELIEIQHKRAEYTIAEAKRMVEEYAKRVAADERVDARRRSEDAFAALRKTESGNALAERWNAFVRAEHDKEKLQADPEFMAAYRAAVDAQTLGEKRKAISEFLKRYEGKV